MGHNYDAHAIGRQIFDLDRTIFPDKVRLWLPDATRSNQPASAAASLGRDRIATRRHWLDIRINM
jgi:hypothetical protein